MALPQFHRLRIAERRAETSNAISVAFEVPEALREAYRFRPGQFLTLEANVAGESLRRAYSICSSSQHYDDHGELRIAIKRVDGGRFSSWAHDTLTASQHLDVMTPDGRFGLPDASGADGYHLALAAGSGITPMLSIMHSTLAGHPRSHFTLIYGNRNVRSIMFLEALEALKNRYLDRLQIFHVLSDEPTEIELLSGRLDEARLQALLRDAVAFKSIDQCFVCGPAPMMDTAERVLLDRGLNRSRIHIERFGSAPSTAPVSAARPSSATPSGQAASPSPGQAQVMLRIDGKARRLSMPFDGPSILDAGLAAGANLPYACKAGVCCTCRARLLEGKVAMGRHDTLDAREIADGFVLTCQARPLSDRVVLSYDER